MSELTKCRRALLVGGMVIYAGLIVAGLVCLNNDMPVSGVIVFLAAILVGVAMMKLEC